MSQPEKANPQLGFNFTEPEPEPVPNSVPELVRPSSRRIWTVHELVAEVRLLVERGYTDLRVEGEISNLRSAPSGHVYFTLKDGESQLPVVLFRRQASLLRFRPKDGLQVMVRGKISVYEQRGQLQIVAESLEPLGEGSLQLAFEQLKEKLRAEGLFDEERKQPLPPFPRTIGIITSPTGAVIRDFLNIASRRYHGLNVLIYPASVQGVNAASEVAAGIEYFNAENNVDLIVLARGGGSLEDLAPFNTESLARSIAASRLPVVSAIGHETDFTIADFVADLRAPTPSAAAELVTAAQHRIEERIEELTTRLIRALRYCVLQASQRFARVSLPAVTARLQALLGRRQQRVDELMYRAEAAVSKGLRQQRTQLDSLHTCLLRQDVRAQVSRARERLTHMDSRLCRLVEAQLARAAQRHAALQARLESLSPLAVLDRGYALVYSTSGQLLTSAGDVHEGDMLSTRLASGMVHSRVTQTEGNSKQ